MGIRCIDPWPHAEFDAFLPPPMAARLLSHWPVDGFKWLKHSDIVQPDGTSLRRYQPVADAFPDIAQWLVSARLQAKMCELLDVDPEQPLYPQALLVEDLPGYRIRRHTDCAGKVISAQVYLGQDDAHETRGVILQTVNGERMKQIPYRFNHGYAFKVTGSSWHRVLKADTGRRSIQLIYYSTQNPRI
jgi:hypothetical protein